MLRKIRFPPPQHTHTHTHTLRALSSSTIGSLSKRRNRKPIARNSLIHSLTVGVAARLLLYIRHKSSALLSPTFACPVAILGCARCSRPYSRALSLAERTNEAKGSITTSAGPLLLSFRNVRRINVCRNGCRSRRLYAGSLVGISSVLIQDETFQHRWSLHALPGVNIQGDSFGTRPKKMRISQRLFIRF